MNRARRDAPPRSPGGPRLHPWTVLFSKEPAALAGSITQGLSKPTPISSRYDENAKVEACTAHPPYPNGTQLSLEQLLHASGYFLASDCQPASITAASQTHSHYQQQTPTRLQHLWEESKCRRFEYLPLNTYSQKWLICRAAYEAF